MWVVSPKIQILVEFILSVSYKLGIWISNLTATAVARRIDATLKHFYLLRELLVGYYSAIGYPYISSLDAVTCNFTFIRFAEISGHFCCDASMTSFSDGTEESNVSY